jgi:hypothetical protein
MSDSLFENSEKAEKELAALKKQMAELASKVEASNKEKESLQGTWQEEKARLEKTLQEQTPWVQAARQFNELAEKNPDEAIQKILANKKRKEQEASKAANASAGGSVNAAEILKPIQEELSSIKEKMTKDEEKRQIQEFQEAIYEAVDYLKTQGVSTDEKTPYEIVSFMKSKGLTDPSHVDLAAKSLYSSALIESATKKKKGNQEAVVLGTGGFSGDEEPAEEGENEEQNAAPRQKKYKEQDGYYRDDKLWKTLEKSL